MNWGAGSRLCSCALARADVPYSKRETDWVGIRTLYMVWRDLIKSGVTRSKGYSWTTLFNWKSISSTVKPGFY